VRCKLKMSLNALEQETITGKKTAPEGKNGERAHKVQKKRPVKDGRHKPNLTV